MQADHVPFIKAIKSSPDDDLPRLVFADYLDENGDPDRAEFIRLQCHLAQPKFLTKAGNPRMRRASAARNRCRALLNLHWREWAVLPDGYKSASVPSLIGGRTFNVEVDGVVQVFRRGFVAEVWCPLLRWCGGNCRCVWGTPPSDVEWCNDCGNRGRADGVGAAIVAEHPVELVTATNARPHFGRDTWFYWVLEGAGFAGGADTVPPHVFSRLLNHHPDATGCLKGFATEESAHADLSAVLLSLAQQEAKNADRLAVA